MYRTKIITMLIMIISLLLSVSSCQRIQNIKNGLDVMTDSGKVLKNAQQLFDDRDVDGLYDLFSVEAKKDEFLKERIELLMYYCDLINLDKSKAKIKNTSGGKSVNDGIITFYEDGRKIDNCYDASGKRYYIDYRFISIDKNNPDNEGLYDIYLDYHNTMIYGTQNNETVLSDELIVMDDLVLRIKDVFNRIENAKKDNWYIQSDDEERIIIIRTLIDDIIKDEMNMYGNSVIIPQSIEETTTDDSINEYPALSISFVDGGSFVILVHNNRIEVRDN